MSLNSKNDRKFLPAFCQRKGPNNKESRSQKCVMILLLTKHVSTNCRQKNT